MTQAIQDLKAKSHLQACISGKLYHSQQSIEELELAFFFLDIRDFTPFIASRPAPEVMHLLQQLFAIFRQAITKNGGTIVETAGDGLYAVFGLNTSLKQATDSAVVAGFTILQQLEEANQTCFKPLFHHCFQVGIGLHTGKGIVGQLGLGVNNNMTVMGYAVNLAARLQQATKILNNNFIISAEAYWLLPHPPLADYELIALKGIPDAMPVYLLGNAYGADCQEEAAWKVAC